MLCKITRISSGEFYQTVKEELTPILPKILQKAEEEEALKLIL